MILLILYGNSQQKAVLQKKLFITIEANKAVVNLSFLIKVNTTNDSTTKTNAKWIYF